MNVGNVKDMDRRAFDLTTPYRIFRFVISLSLCLRHSLSLSVFLCLCVSYTVSLFLNVSHESKKSVVVLEISVGDQLRVVSEGGQ